MAANIERCPACKVALTDHPYCVLCRCYVHADLLCGRDRAICKGCDGALERRSLRRCKKCEAIKPRADFAARARVCNTCKRARDKANKARNLEHSREVNRRWRERNVERVRGYRRAWAKAHPERAAAKKRRQAERRRPEIRRRYAANPEAHRAANRASYRRNREKYAARKRAKQIERKLAILRQIKGEHA